MLKFNKITWRICLGSHILSKMQSSSQNKHQSLPKVGSQSTNVCPKGSKFVNSGAKKDPTAEFVDFGIPREKSGRHDRRCCHRGKTLKSSKSAVLLANSVLWVRGCAGLVQDVLYILLRMQFVYSWTNIGLVWHAAGSPTGARRIFNAYSACRPPYSRFEDSKFFETCKLQLEVLNSNVRMIDGWYVRMFEYSKV